MGDDFKVVWTTDDSGYKAFKSQWPGKLDQFGRALCSEIVKDVKLELSKRASPASYGGPPGVDTNALRGGITFTPKGHLTWWVHDQVEYGIYLELGRLNHRTGVHMTWPFMTPVFMRWRSTKAAALAKSFDFSPGGFGIKVLHTTYG